MLFLTTTKFGFISLQLALRKLGIKGYDFRVIGPYARIIERQYVRLFNYSSAEVYDVEYGC